MGFLKIIHHSGVFKERFAELVTAIDDNPAPDSSGRIRSVRAANHRMESSQMPLARFVLYHDAMMTVAAEIVCLRRDKTEGKLPHISWSLWMTENRSS